MLALDFENRQDFFGHFGLVLVHIIDGDHHKPKPKEHTLKLCLCLANLVVSNRLKFALAVQDEQGRWLYSVDTILHHSATLVKHWAIAISYLKVTGITFQFVWNCKCNIFFERSDNERSNDDGTWRWFRSLGSFVVLIEQWHGNGNDWVQCKTICRLQVHSRVHAFIAWAHSILIDGKCWIILRIAFLSHDDVEE